MQSVNLPLGRRFLAPILVGQKTTSQATSDRGSEDNPKPATRWICRLQVLLVALLLSLGTRSLAQTEKFKSATALGWVLQGPATLTSGGPDQPGDGWLRLTPAAGYNTSTASGR